LSFLGLPLLNGYNPHREVREAKYGGISIAEVYEGSKEGTSIALADMDKDGFPDLLSC